MNLNYTEEKLEALLDSFTNIELIPASYSPLLVPFYESIAQNERLKILALRRCRQIFDNWENLDGISKEPEIVQRCSDIWFIINGEDYIFKRPLPTNLNLVTEEIEISEFIEPGQLVRLEFDTKTGELISSPLANLIIEEVEVANFVDVQELSDK